jgi:hypothetical protein
MTTIQAAKVPRPPSTAVSGTSNPNALTLRRGRHSRSRSGSLWRSRITETWAIVNDSIAPKEYIVASSSVSPGISAIAPTAENARIAMYGVLKRGWTWRSPSGSWRCWPME